MASFASLRKGGEAGSPGPASLNQLQHDQALVVLLQVLDVLAPRGSNADARYEPTREAAMAAFAKSWRRE
jgi:hypothetical protein